jgi:hypothetical protein
VRAVLRDHKSKWQIVVSELVREREYLHQADNARLFEELSVVAYLGKLLLAGAFQGSLLSDPLWHDAVNRWGRRREMSIYIEEVRGAFKKPSDRIPPGTAVNAVSRSRTAVRYYEPLVPMVAAFLANPPTEVPWPYVLSLWQRLLAGELGGATSNDLLS